MILATGRGFTLLEVLVALAILAIVMAAVNQALNSSVQALSHVQQQTYASQVAQNVMEKSRAGILRTSTGQETFGPQEWYWRLEGHSQSLPGLDGPVGQIEWVRVSVYSDADRETKVAGLMGTGP